MLGYSFGFGIFGVMFTIVFVLVIGVFIVTAVRGFSQWNQNNNSPRLTVEAEVVAKWTNVTHHSHPVAGDASGAHSTSSTTYYVTFQVASGDRMEFHVPSSEYGMLVEGDFGSLSFQGTRYLGFDRQ